MSVSKSREILHVDFNNFFASVECLHDPSLRGKAVAVAGDSTQRRGIILAKNELAKAFGVKTAEPIRDALKKCPKLVLVKPHYELYDYYSRVAREYFETFSDCVESMGADEAWIDITGCEKYLGMTAIQCANEIRETIKSVLGLTVSVGVSFNKIFAKLGSDLKKPDATTVITRENFRSVVWPLPASAMLGVGPSVETSLNTMGIRTIGQLAAVDVELLRQKFGKNGDALSLSARGEDESAVCKTEYRFPVKSVGHGANALADITDPEDARIFILSLAPNVAHRLNAAGKYAGGIAISVRDNDLSTKEYQMQLNTPTRSTTVLAQEAFYLLNCRHVWRKPIRSICIRAINLTDDSAPFQPSLFYSTTSQEKLDRLEEVVDRLRCRFGNSAPEPAAITRHPLIPSDIFHTKSASEKTLCV